MVEGKPAYGTVRKQLARRISDAAPELSALDSVINELKSAAEVPAIIKTKKVLVPDETTVAENRELKRRIIELEEQFERERRQHREDLDAAVDKWGSQLISRCCFFIGRGELLKIGFPKRDPEGPNSLSASDDRPRIVRDRRELAGRPSPT